MLGELRLQRRQPGEDRLDRGVLLGVEPGQLLGDLGERVLRRPRSSATRPCTASSRSAKRSSAAAGRGASISAELRLQRRQPGEAPSRPWRPSGRRAGSAARRSPRTGSPPASIAATRPCTASSRSAKRSRAAPAGERGLELGELRLQRREPGEDRLDGRVLLGVEPGQLLGDLRERVLRRRVERRALHRVEPLGEAVERGAGRGRRGRPRARRCGRPAPRPARPSGPCSRRQLLGELGARRAGSRPSRAASAGPGRAGLGAPRRPSSFASSRPPARSRPAAGRRSPEVAARARRAAPRAARAGRASPRARRSASGPGGRPAARRAPPRVGPSAGASAASRASSAGRGRGLGAGRARRAGREPVEQRPRLGGSPICSSARIRARSWSSPASAVSSVAFLSRIRPRSCPAIACSRSSGARALAVTSAASASSRGRARPGQRRAPRAGRRRCAAPAAGRRDWPRRRLQRSRRRRCRNGQPEGAEGREPRRAQSRHADAEGLHDPSARVRCPWCRPEGRLAGTLAGQAVSARLSRRGGARQQRHICVTIR